MYGIGLPCWGTSTISSPFLIRLRGRASCRDDDEDLRLLYALLQNHGMNYIILRSWEIAVHTFQCTHTKADIQGPAGLPLFCPTFCCRPDIEDAPRYYSFSSVHSDDCRRLRRPMSSAPPLSPVSGVLGVNVSPLEAYSIQQDTYAELSKPAAVAG
jgi:hypothetical protein